MQLRRSHAPRAHPVFVSSALFCVRAFVAAVALPGALALCMGGCSDRDEGTGAALKDASFGRPAQPFEDASATPDAAQNPRDAGPGEGTLVTLRVFPGVVNLPASYLCHDPDYVLDDPDTLQDETAPGPVPATELPLLDGGVAALGVPTAYVQLAPLTSGAITVHRLPSLDGGREAGPSDAALAGDAEPMDGAALDGSDGAAEAPPARCTPDSLEAVMPLTPDLGWLGPPLDPDAGGDSDAAARADRGFVAQAAGGDILTLFGSGFALDAAELTRRQNAQYDSVLQASGDMAQAAAAGRRARQRLEANYGLRFLMSRAGSAAAGRVALSLSHLVPDVPAVPVGQAAPETGSGALHLCMTVGGMEVADTFNGPQGFEFRNFTPIGSDLDPAVTYRFRLFVQADFPTGPNACATTSLKPVAELQLDPAHFAAGGSYTLVAWGALSSDSICTGTTPLVRPSCARPADMLRPRIDVLENAPAR